MYFVEGMAQPEQFGSIPRALWWSIATLTTVGYGLAFGEPHLTSVIWSAIVSAYFSGHDRKD